MRSRQRVLVLLCVLLCGCGRQSENNMVLPAVTQNAAVLQKISQAESSETQAPAAFERRLVKKVELTLNVADAAAASESLTEKYGPRKVMRDREENHPCADDT